MPVPDFLAPFTPVNFLAVFIVLMMFLSAIQLVRAVRSGRERLDGLYAVSLVGWGNAFSMVTGFSIGWIVAMVNIVIGIILFMLVKAFRIPLAVVTLISILLALSLRGTYIPAMFILYWVLAGCAFAAIISIVNNRHQRSDEAFSFAALSLVASLAGIAFYFIPGAPFLSKWIAMGAAGIGAILIIAVKHYRVLLLEIVFASLLCWSIFLTINK